MCLQEEGSRAVRSSPRKKYPQGRLHERRLALRFLRGEGKIPGKRACIRAQNVPKVLKRCYSLKRNKNFRRVYRKGKSAGTPLLVLLYAKSREDRLHVGLSVSKKLGNSVVRNRVKRRLRESFTPLIPCVKTGYDLIFIAREPVVQAEFSEIAKAMRKLLRKAALLLPQEREDGEKKERE